MPYLLKDVKSHLKRGHIYARKGQQVEIIAVKGNVSIVQIIGTLEKFTVQNTEIS